MPNRIQISFFHDVLCAYCSITAERLRLLKHEFGDSLAITLRSYPLRPEESPLDQKDLKRIVRHVKTAAKEIEGRGIVPDIWCSDDPPRSSLVPLIASEAALLQGRDKQDALVWRLRTAAFRGGLNVARRDVVMEIASSVGLDMPRFAAAFDARGTQRTVELSLHDAIAHGVRALPAITIGDDWLLTGVRSLDEYRDVLLRWMERRGTGGRSVRVVH